MKRLSITKNIKPTPGFLKPTVLVTHNIYCFQLTGVYHTPSHSIEYGKQSPEVFYKKGIPKNFSKFRVKHLCQSLSFNKVAG